MDIYSHLFRRAILTRKVSKNGLVFGVRSEFMVCARKITSLCVQRLGLRFNASLCARYKFSYYYHYYYLWRPAV